MADKYISVEAAKDLAMSYIEDDELCAKACEDYNDLPATDVVPYEIYLHDVLSRDMALQQIGASSESTQPHGEWLYEPITCGDYVVGVKRVCSRCHWSENAVERTAPIAAPVRNYCPNCGADMRGESDD